MNLYQTHRQSNKPIIMWYNGQWNIYSYIGQGTSPSQLPFLFYFQAILPPSFLLKINNKKTSEYFLCFSFQSIKISGDKPEPILVTSTSEIPKPKYLATACRRAIQTTPGGERSHRPTSSSCADKAPTKEIIRGHNSHMDMPFAADTSVPGFSHCVCCMLWQSSLWGHRGELEPCFPTGKEQ